MKRYAIATVLTMTWGLFACIQPQKSKGYWITVVDKDNNRYGYVNQNGDTVIPLGKYPICFTDTFTNYAIVLKPNYGIVAINRRQKILYKVFQYDNGPDPVSEGYFRILKDNKIGYADASTGKIMIAPQYNCAFPFENGMAKVSVNCSTQQDGEYHTWVSNQWFYIDKKGKKIVHKNE